MPSRAVQEVPGRIPWETAVPEGDVLGALSQSLPHLAEEQELAFSEVEEAKQGECSSQGRCEVLVEVVSEETCTLGGRNEIPPTSAR